MQASKKLFQLLSKTCKGNLDQATIDLMTPIINEIRTLEGIEARLDKAVEVSIGNGSAVLTNILLMVKHGEYERTSITK